MAIDELSTREKQALGALCLAAFCGRFAIAHEAVEALIAHQVLLLCAPRLPDWERAGAGLRLAGRGDPIPEEVLSVVPTELHHGFARLVDYTGEIGCVDMYGAPTAEPRRCLLQAMDVLNAHAVAAPDAELVKVQPRPLAGPWGEPVPQEACGPILDRCRVLLRGA